VWFSLWFHRQLRRLSEERGDFIQNAIWEVTLSFEARAWGPAYLIPHLDLFCKRAGGATRSCAETLGDPAVAASRRLFGEQPGHEQDVPVGMDDGVIEHAAQDLSAVLKREPRVGGEAQGSDCVQAGGHVGDGVCGGGQHGAEAQEFAGH